MFVRVCPGYADLISGLRDRSVEMQISRQALDEIAGLSDGYAAKVLSSSYYKVLGPISMGPTLEALGLVMMLVEDTAATARTISKRTPVAVNHQRFGNKSRAGQSLKIEHVADSAAVDNSSSAAPAPVPPATPPVARAHLRIVQSKRGGHFG